MAWQYVQDTGKVIANNVGDSQISFGVLPTVGNHLFHQSVLWNGFGGFVDALSDNQGNTWNGDVNSNGTSSALNVLNASTFVQTSAGMFTVDISGTQAFGNYWTYIISEYSGGLPAVAPAFLDQFGENADFTGNASVIASGINTDPDDLVLATMGLIVTGDANCNITNPTVGFTQLMVEQDSVNNIPGQAAFKIVSALETSQANWTNDSPVAPDGWNTVISSYLPDPNPPAPTPLMQGLMGARRRRGNIRIVNVNKEGLIIT